MAQSFILLVEDNPDDVFLASRIIGKVCTDEILVARDGEEASELCGAWNRTVVTC